MPDETTATDPLAGISRALVIGLGASGLAAGRALHAHGVEVVVVDDRDDHPAAGQARAEGLDVREGQRPIDALDAGLDLVVPSPGVPEHAPVLTRAAAGGIAVWSEPELGARLYPRRLLAVTGTNGKTSTTELLAEMLVAGGLDAVPCGNIGLPFTTAAAAASPDAVLVAELSSFQLRFASRMRAEVGVLLNVAPDHLDWHADMEAYAAAKARIWHAQREGDWAIANADDPVARSVRDRSAPASRADVSGAQAVEQGVGRDGAQLRAALPTFTGEVLPVDAVAGGLGPAPHHLANVAAASCAALLAGVEVGRVAAAAAAWRPGRHRFEVVAIDTAHDVTYVDDSKATNPHAAAAALDAVERGVWIAGGLAKGVDLAPLADHLDGIRAAVLIGTAAPELAEIAARAGVSTRQAESIEEAVEHASALAHDGDTVLLAPACASFDQFSSYTERGDRFAAAARRAAGASAHQQEGRGR